MKKLVWILCVLLIACSVGETEEVEVVEDNPKSKMLEVVEELTTSDSVSNQRIAKLNDGFLVCYDGIALGIGTHNDSLFNSFIHKNHGLYVIESSGAMPMIRKFYNIRNFKTNNEDRTINELLYHEMEEPVFESLPKVICDKEVYDKQGCFAQEINSLSESQIWNYANLNEKEIQAIEFLAETVSITVVNTLNFIFYFSKIEGKWYLTFLDLRVPCTA